MSNRGGKFLRQKLTLSIPRFHAAVFSKNITSILVASARERVEKAASSRTIGYKSNFTQALSTMRDTIVVLFRGTRKTILRIISDLLETIARAVEPVRPGRKYPRNHKRAQKKFCLNYKPILKLMTLNIYC